MSAEALSQGQSDLSSLKRHGLLGLAAVIGLMGGLVGWAALTNISGAIIAPGTLMVESNAKQVQHAEGGIVTELLVRNEDVVEGGQLLVRLDQTAIAAGLEISEAQLREAFAREARLAAEIEGRARAELSDAALTMFSPGELSSLLYLEQQALNVRLATKSGRIAQLNEQIVQLNKQREGLLIQQQALETQIGILDAEIADFDALYEQRLVASSRGTALNKDLASARGQLGQVVAAIAQSDAAERALQIEQIRDEFLTGALAELQETRGLIVEASQRRVAERDRLQRTEIRAPQHGVVHESILHTVGGVVAPGETLMLIVPTDEPLLVNVRVDPIDIDKVYVGQEVVLRLPGLNPRTTPELFASITRVAPDATIDTATGLHYYAARISISDEELSRLPDGVQLVPGMPVEAYMQIDDRTVLSYLINPFTEQMRRALREE
ncbi:HlyD family type I secretion periplasmic adaptor subunit [uncultured Devosia sp.]|uniref:HlyD family type I secretion periplasmic adaptor subunit n=1 Tax=uncultured Devosia sp. TaxID=211434 RepID=UPI002606B5A9|nr:HlyD family type I secretion periplasmic adaptor subunit [uncultured Devosia sp.]